jgi:hypothetical protein
VFLRRTGQDAGDYEYLGTAIDEDLITISGRDAIQYALL